MPEPPAASSRRRQAVARLREATASEAGEAGALAVATLANNAIQLAFTVAVARILGSDGYGSLAALVSTFLILLVTGQSLQAAAAREGALGNLGTGPVLAANLRAWTRTIGVAVVALAVLGAAIGGPLAALAGTPDHRWGAAAIPATGGLWLLVCLQRGVLQGLHALRPVGLSLVWEALVRLVAGLALAAVAGVAGAFLALLVCFGAVAVGLHRSLVARTAGTGTAASPSRSLRSLIGDGWGAILALVVLALLQNVDVIVARHQLGGDRAGAYAVAAVAAKAIVWVAIGVGLQLLPQATDRAARGEDPRPVLRRALAIVGLLAVPALVLFAAVPEPLLRLAFGPDTVEAAPALVRLGLAMSLLAVSYLCVQFLVAIGRIGFVAVLALAVAAELTLLFSLDLGITAFAGVVAAVQLGAAAALVVVTLRAWPGRTT